MNIYEKLGEALNVELTDDYKLNATDLEISTWNTADGYEVHIMTEDSRQLNWEYDVYYYEPSFDEVMARIKDLPSGSTVYLCDYEQYLPEYEVKDWLAEHYDDEDKEEDNRSTVEILQDLSNYTRHDG